MNIYPDTRALVDNDKPPGLRTLVQALIDAEGLKAPAIVQVEVAYSPGDGAPRRVLTSDGGELPRYHIGGVRSISAWAEDAVRRLADDLSDTPYGRIDMIVWLDSKKAEHKRRASGTVGATGAGAGAGRFAGITGMVPLGTMLEALAEQESRHRRDVQALMGQNTDLVGIIADMGMKGLQVGEKVPDAMTSALVALHQVGGGVWGQVAGAVAGAVVGGSPAPQLRQVGSSAPPLRISGPGPEEAPGEKGPDPTPEQVAGALCAQAPGTQAAIVSAWAQRCPEGVAALRAEIKASAELRGALGLPELALRFL